MKPFFTTVARTTFAGALLATLAFPVLAETVIRRGNGGEPQTLDQAQISIDIEGFIQRDLSEGLMVYDRDGKVVHGTAESHTLSDDGKVYTFRIRDGAKWSDGSPVVAGDFVYSMSRVLDPATAAGYANILYPIKGAEGFNKKTGKAEDLGLKAVDDRTLEITLERPTPYFLQLLAHYTAIPVNKASIEKHGKDFTKPGNFVSNGAYMLTDYVANDHITAVKNPNYWDVANVKIDKVIYNPSEDQAATERMFEAGELDVVYNYQADQREHLTTKYGADQVFAAPASSTYYYVFDNRKEPFNDVRVRKALSMALDREFLAGKIFGGAQLPSFTLVPSGMEGYTLPKIDIADMDQLDREDAAKALLKEAGYGDGGKPLTIDIRYNTNENHKKVAIAVADMWKALGTNITVTTQNLDVKAHYAFLQEGGSFDVARAGWSADYADPENFLNLMISSNTAFNYGKWTNAKYDELLKASYDETDPVKRMQVLNEAEALMLAEHPIAPMMNYASLWLINKKVKGFNQNLVNEHLTRYLSIEE
ncbi:MAG: peptide ABC transporter substrate-binding protein [Rhizobium sp.]|nr:peptide ABC transporter substrate-binding protein [Rhizobium sp.]